MDAKVMAVIADMNKRQLQRVFVDTGTPYETSETADDLRAYVRNEYAKGELVAEAIIDAYND